MIKLKDLKPCETAYKFAQKFETMEQVIDACPRGDWLLWLAAKLEVDIRLLTLAKARCAKMVMHLMEDQRSIDAVNVAEKFGLGEATRKELDAAAYAAYAAYADADDAADAAAAAAHSADAAADAAHSAAADDAAAAAAHSAAAADAADAAAAALKENRLQTANICRELLKEEILKRVEL